MRFEVISYLKKTHGQVQYKCSHVSSLGASAKLCVAMLPTARTHKGLQQNVNRGSFSET